MGQIIEEDISHNHIPEYSVRFETDDFVMLRNRGVLPKLPATAAAAFVDHISGDGYEEARVVAPGWGVYEIEREWRAWLSESPRDIDKAFVGFCRVWYEKRGSS